MLHGPPSLQESRRPIVSLPNSTGSESRPVTALFFPGQGTQRVSMISYLLQNFSSTVSPMLELLDHTIYESDRAFPPTGTTTASISPKPRLSTLICSGPAPLLTATENAQPAILFTSLCFLSVLEKDFGLELRKTSTRSNLYFLGHSLGEFSALVAGGIMSLPDAIALVRRRGITMTQSVPEEERGDVGMYAIISPAEHLQDLISTINSFITSPLPGPIPPGKIVGIANHNTSSQIVISGHISAITALLDHLRKFSGHDPRALKLNVSAPFHSSLMAPAVDILREELAKVKLDWKSRSGDVVGNVTARVYETERELRDILPRQAVEAVRWAESIQYLEREKGVNRWIGFGPEVKVGRGLVKRDIRGESEVIMVGEGMKGKELGGVVELLER
ncbi:acyl transferase/acyl hydrolase/lysophospholipase [Tirmania nivea]|nr:acyl transferase/acyl hydrolase/lysophospholipase [Tirmania nivea]